MTRGEGGESVAMPASELAAKLRSGIGVNFERMVDQVRPLGPADRESVKAALIDHIQDHILRGQVQDLQGADVLMQELGIEGIGMSETTIAFMRTFMARVDEGSLVSFIISLERLPKPEHLRTARQFLERNFGEADDTGAQLLLDMDQFMVKLFERRVTPDQLAGERLSQLPRLLGI